MIFDSKDALLAHTTDLLKNVSNDAERTIRFEFPDTPAHIEETITLHFTPLIKIIINDKECKLRNEVRSSGIEIQFLDISTQTFNSVDAKDLLQRNRFFASLELGQVISLLKSWGDDLILFYCDYLFDVLSAFVDDNASLKDACSSIRTLIHEVYFPYENTDNEVFKNNHDNYLVSQLSSRYDLHHLIDQHTTGFSICRPNRLVPSYEITPNSKIYSLGQGLTMNDLFILNKYREKLNYLSYNTPSLYKTAVAYSIRVAPESLASILDISINERPNYNLESFLENKFKGNKKLITSYSHDIKIEELAHLQSEAFEFHLNYEPVDQSSLIYSWLTVSSMIDEEVKDRDYEFLIQRMPLATLAIQADAIIQKENIPPEIKGDFFIDEFSANDFNRDIQELLIGQESNFNQLTHLLISSIINDKDAICNGYDYEVILSKIRSFVKILNQKINNIIELSNTLQRIFFLKQKDRKEIPDNTCYIPGSIKSNLDLAISLIPKKDEYISHNHLFNHINNLDEDSILYKFKDLFDQLLHQIKSILNYLDTHTFYIDLEDFISKIESTEKQLEKFNCLKKQKIEFSGNIYKNKTESTRLL